MKLSTLHSARPLAANAFAVVLAAFATSCRSSPIEEPRPLTAAEAGELRAPSSLPIDVLWRQRVSATWEDPRRGGERGERSFDAAVQKRGDALTLIGLSPLGTTGFVITLNDGASDVEFTNRSGEELPFPPRFVLLDVQRVFFPWLAGDAPLADGVHEGDVAGAHVVEEWRGGRLIERRFTSAGREGEVIVRHGVERDGWLAPAQATLENGWFGYRLAIETLEETQLEGRGEQRGSALLSDRDRS